MRTRGLAALSVALLTGAALGDGLGPGEVEILRASVERLREAGDLTAEKAWAFEFAELTPGELDIAPDALPDAELPKELRGALRRVCRTAALRRGPLGRLANARDVCYLLGSPHDGDWLKAFRMLRREPFSDDLDRAVIALGKDGRPEVRLIAARLATSLVVFGRKAEGLMDTVLACLVDPNPNVVAACSLCDAPLTRDKRAIDRIVACLKDERAIDRRASPILNMGDANTVSDFVQTNLSWSFWMERRARVKFEPPSFDGAGNMLPRNEHVYVRLSPDEIRQWWKENRDAFGFETPAPQWACVFDDVIVIDVGKPATIVDAQRVASRVHLQVFREGWHAGRPVTTVEGEIRTEVVPGEDHVITFGNPDHYDGWVNRSGGTWGNGWVVGQHLTRVAFLPTDKPGRVRMKLTIHIGHLER